MSKSKSELAAFLGCSLSTLSRWVATLCTDPETPFTLAEYKRHRLLPPSWSSYITKNLA